MGDNCLSPLKLPTMTADEKNSLLKDLGRLVDGGELSRKAFQWMFLEVMAINTAKSPPSSAYCQEPPLKKEKKEHTNPRQISSKESRINVVTPSPCQRRSNILYFDSPLDDDDPRGHPDGGDATFKDGLLTWTVGNSVNIQGTGWTPSQEELNQGDTAFEPTLACVSEPEEHAQDCWEEDTVPGDSLPIRNDWLPPTKTGLDSMESARNYIKGLPFNFTKYTHWGKFYSVYQCKSHLACGVRVRAKGDQKTGLFDIQFNGCEHSSKPIVGNARGIPPRLRRVVDDLFNTGANPSQVWAFLSENSEHKEFVKSLDRCKTMKMIRHRKQNFARLRKGPNILENSADLMDWAASHSFPGNISGFDACDPTDLHVLPYGYRSDVRAVVFSCSDICANILRAQIDRPDGFSIMLDGTWKLHSGGWVLITAGVISLDWKREDSRLSQSFRPVAYCFAESENHDAVALLLNAVKELCFR